MKVETEAMQENPQVFQKIPQAFPPVMVLEKPVIVTLPFNVVTDLNQFHRIYISKEYDYFKIVHNYEDLLRDYIVYGEMPDGDKKILFTVSKHFECKVCRCFDDCFISALFCDYVCCDRMIFQMDYKRNGVPFYTQGINMQKGCYFCRFYSCLSTCYHCNCCFNCSINRLYLRKNIDPDSPDFNVGIKKGVTDTVINCCATDYISTYTTQEGFKGQGVRARCCEVFKAQLANNFRLCNGDLEIDIEDANGLKTGNVMIYSGNYSQKSGGRFCYKPRKYFEVNMPPNASSEQKFQIIADLIHFDLVYRAL